MDERNEPAVGEDAATDSAAKVPPQQCSPDELEAEGKIPMPLVSQPSVYELCVSRITEVFDDTLSFLTETLNQSYANEIEELEAEAKCLSGKYARLEKNKADCEFTLPAEERLTQHEADQLLLSGSPTARQDAQAKLSELNSFRRGIVETDQRISEISARLHNIQVERRGIAKEVFEAWHGMARCKTL